MSSDIHSEPWIKTDRLSSGQEILVRPLRDDDGSRLGEYFRSLSEQTRGRYGPHPFDQKTADEICATINPREMVRLVASVPGAEGERIIAYMLLKMGILDFDRDRYEQLGIPLDPKTDCT